MNKISLKIRMVYDNLGDAERRVADFLMASPEKLVPLSITQLAKQCLTSEATVTRLAKKMDYDGFQQLKIAVVQDAKIPTISTNICENDSPYDIFNKVSNDIYCSLEKTKKILSAEDLESVCKAILIADEILIFGLGNSASIAYDAEHKLLRLGLNAHACTDNHMQAILSSHTTEKSFVIGISHSGSSTDIVNALKICKQNGATTACLTNYGKSPIYRVSDYVLNTVSDETNYTVLGLNSRIAQLAIIDTIYSYLVCHYDNAKTAINLTEESLHDKKF
ncbi:MAG: MurR/RpiR family transcriptional regulator [Clostridia bacterium]|nr:MurR/RpiR family transcriptional regulator [Clostridia bacterium]